MAITLPTGEPYYRVKTITALFLIWDNASWHKSQHVRQWLRAYNREVKRTGQGVRLIACLLLGKSPWLNPIEPKWVHGKRAISERASCTNSTGSRKTLPQHLASRRSGSQWHSRARAADR